MAQKSILEFILEGFGAPNIDFEVFVGRRYVRSTKNFSGRRKIKCWGSSETRFGKVSRRSEPSSRGKRPFKVSKNFDPENFKRLKNREDSSDFDDFWTESIATPRTKIWKSFPRRRQPRRRRHRLCHPVVVVAAGGAIAAFSETSLRIHISFPAIKNRQIFAQI